jgi:hypothetical protein
MRPIFCTRMAELLQSVIHSHCPAADAQVVGVLRSELRRVLRDSAASEQLRTHAEKALELQASCKAALDELLAARDIARWKVSIGCVLLCQ